MDKVIVIEGQTELDGIIDGQVNIDTQIDGEFGTFFEITPPTPPPTPVPELVIKDVMFMDYDGSVVASYDAADFIANVTALPTPPSHDGLTFQEWNWDLADIKTELQTGSGACCIGACYETTDGKTHFYINLTDQEQTMRIQFRLQHTSGTHTVNWGDGTTETVSSTTYMRHLYANYGEYEITVDGGVWTLSATGEGIRSIPLNDADIGGYYASHTNTFLKKLYVGSGCRIANTDGNIFRFCPNLELITIHKDFIVESGQMALSNLFFASGIKFFAFPKGIGASTSTNNSVMNNCFSGCNKLVAVSFPKGFRYLKTAMNPCGIRFFYFPYISLLDAKNSNTTLANCFNLKRVVMAFDSYTSSYTNGMYQSFYNCYQLESITLDKMKFSSPNGGTFYTDYNLRGEITVPSSVTVLSGTNFYYCQSVTKITLLGNMTSIGSSAFTNCYSCMEWDFTHCTSVPTLVNTSAFTGIRPTAKIKVPASLESSWKTAANWSTYASYIVGV